MAYWHAADLSPDPTRVLPATPTAGGWQQVDLHPHALAWSNRPIAPPTLDIASARPVAFDTSGDEIDLVFDFGTEVDAALELTILCDSSGSIAISFGESIWEAREWGPPSICHDQRPRKQHVHVAGAGRHAHTFEEGGFRFVRIRCVDFHGKLQLIPVAHARFALGAPQGSFECSDALFQRIWQSALYTARLCTRPTELWDGIKRDRLGWYGDARITSLAISQAWLDPAPAMGMLRRLQTDRWANDIPNFSFDAFAMLHRHILTFGTDADGVHEVFQKAKALLEWIQRTHLAEDGRLQRADGVPYFFNIGFIDWSPQPLGGRLEELAPVQFAWLEALIHLADVARWLDDEPAAQRCSELARRLKARLRELFWRDGIGFDHTLNQVDPPATPWRMPLEPNVHYERTYVKQERHGPSGPSLQSTARALMAGGAQDSDLPTLRRNFTDPRIPGIITGFYQYYVNRARALTGDVDGAILALRQYFGPIVQEYDSPTLWESYEPDSTGIRVWSLGAWPKSLCHGWSSGAVPIAAEFLLGITILAPGMRRLAIRQQSTLPWSIRAVVPTPLGPIECEHEPGRARYNVPAGIEVQAGPKVEIVLSGR